MTTNGTYNGAKQLKKKGITEVLTKKKNNGVTLRQLANQTGVSAAAISQIIQRKADPGQKTWTRLTQWLRQRQSDYTVVPTKNFKIIQAICTHAMQERVMVRVLGDTGFGKTTALQAFASTYEGSGDHHIYYIECMDWTQLDFVGAIEKAVGVRSEGNKIKRIQRLREALRERKNALLILDQASALREFVLRLLHPLFGGYNDNAFGIVLAGTDTLHNVMAGAANRHKQLMRELNNRVENDYGRLNSPSKSEVRKICKANHITDDILIARAESSANKYGYACVRKALNDDKFKRITTALSIKTDTL